MKEFYRRRTGLGDFMVMVANSPDVPVASRRQFGSLDEQVRGKV